jgi:hypothetical protein
MSANTERFRRCLAVLVDEMAAELESAESTHEESACRRALTYTCSMLVDRGVRPREEYCAECKTPCGKSLTGAESIRMSDCLMDEMLRFPDWFDKFGERQRLEKRSRKVRGR